LDYSGQAGDAGSACGMTKRREFYAQARFSKSGRFWLSKSSFFEQEQFFGLLRQSDCG
jgi:hypothetical protein